MSRAWLDLFLPGGVVDKSKGPWLSGHQLIERWGLDWRDEETNLRFLRHLRERKFIEYSRPTHQLILYSLASILKLEEEGRQLARADVDLTVRARKPKGRAKSKKRTAA